MIVSTDWLADHLDIVRVLDIRGLVLPPTEPPPHYFAKRDAYAESHIPGALFVDWVHDINDPDDPNSVAGPERYADLMSRLGVGDDTIVVAYDDGTGIFAARLWWTLTYYGHKNVAVLDGGWDKWLKENRPTTPDVPHVEPATFTPSVVPDLRRTADDIATKLGSPDTVLIDVRTEGEFRGEASRAKRGGHIPGAINNRRSTLQNADNTFKSAEEIREAFAQIGVTEDTPEVVFYCNAGVSAALSLLAMRAAGLPNGTLYDGSWKDWGNDDARPIEP